MKRQSGLWWSNCASGEKDSDTVGRGDSDCSILLFGPGLNGTGEDIMYNDCNPFCLENIEYNSITK